MAFTQDPRFDAAFIDNVDNTEPTVTDLSALTVDWLPIMLTRNAGQIGFSRTYASPAADAAVRRTPANAYMGL